MPAIRLKGSITEDGRLNLRGESLPLPPGEVDVIVLFSKTEASTGETQPQFMPYTVVLEGGWGDQQWGCKQFSES